MSGAAIAVTVVAVWIFVSVPVAMVLGRVLGARRREAESGDRVGARREGEYGGAPDWQDRAGCDFG